MKVLYIDISLAGHHVLYLESLMSEFKDSVCLLPESDIKINVDKVIYYNVDRKFNSYLKWVNKICEIIKSEHIEIVHFLYGDGLYKFFGIGLQKIKKLAKVVVTFHQFQYGFLHKISIKKICSKIDFGIVHTSFLKKQAVKIGVKNIEIINYPKFTPVKNISNGEAKRIVGISSVSPVISALTGTRYDKGLDLLLAALEQVQNDFTLLIAGKPCYFSEQFINEHVIRYNDKVVTVLKELTEDELANSVSASDIVVLPYRKIFDGASGPLVEGVAYGKTIIGPNHGSLGQIIKDNHLGYTFESENVDDLARTINKALSENFIYDEYAKKYQSALSVDSFIDSHKNLYDGLTKRQ